jgi:hypothetical protein
MEELNLKKLNNVEVKEQYQVKNLKLFHSSGKHIKTSAKENLGYHQLKQHKPWFDTVL